MKLAMKMPVALYQNWYINRVSAGRARTDEGIAGGREWTRAESSNVWGIWGRVKLLSRTATGRRAI